MMSLIPIDTVSANTIMIHHYWLIHIGFPNLWVIIIPNKLARLAAI